MNIRVNFHFALSIPHQRGNEYTSRTNNKLPFARWAKINILRKIVWALFPLDFVSLSMSSCLHVSISPCSMSHVYVSIFMFPCLKVHVSMFPKFRKQKKELTKNSNFFLFAANGNRKRKFVFLGLQTINSSQRFLLQQTCPSMGSMQGKCNKYVL